MSDAAIFRMVAQGDETKAAEVIAALPHGVLWTMRRDAETLIDLINEEIGEPTLPGRRDAEPKREEWKRARR